MDEDEITQRLRDAGDQPVPGEVRANHLSQMHAAVPVVDKQKRFGRLAVAAAAFVGFAVGSTGFAMAGALPDPAQGVAHDVLSVVQVQVPDRPDNRGQCISNAARTLDGDAKRAAKDECKARIAPGRPDGVGQGNGKAKGRPDHAGTPGGPGGHPHAGDDCKGPPPWAGKGGTPASDADKQAFETKRASCTPGDEFEDDEVEERELEEREAEAPQPQDHGQPEDLPEPSPAPEAGAQGGAPEQTPPAPPAEQAPEQPADEVPSAEGGATDPGAG